MRILVVGPQLPYFFETACARGFADLGCEVLQVDNKPPRWWLGRRDWYQLSRAERTAQDFLASYEIYRKAKQWKPDVIFLCKAENIRAEAFTLLKRELGCRIAIWYVDNPFNANVSSYQALRSIQKADHYFIWAEYLIDPLISAGANSVHFLPFAYDPVSYPADLVIPASEAAHWQSDVCFVGTWDRDREAALAPLAGQKLDLAIYGQGWDSRLSSTSPLHTHVRSGAIWLGDTVKAFKGSKIVLNLLRRHNWHGHNFRTMEAAGIGGGVLATPWTEDQAHVLFEENKEILCFRGERPEPQWLAEQLQDPELLRSMSLAARKRVQREHLLEYRLKRILEIIS